MTLIKREADRFFIEDRLKGKSCQEIFVVGGNMLEYNSPKEIPLNF